MSVKSYVHTTNLNTVRKYQLESWTLIFGHFALRPDTVRLFKTIFLRSWALPNFSKFLKFGTFTQENVFLCFLTQTKWRRKMEKMRQQTYFVSANERPSSLWSRFDKTNLQVVTCKFPKVYKCLVTIYKWNLQFMYKCAYQCSYKCSFCLIVILTVKFIAFRQ